MKNNTVRTVAEWVLIASVFLSAIFFVQFWFHTRTLRRLNTSLQQEMSLYQSNHGMLNMLLNEVVEYSKQHPDIDPILEAVGVRPNRNAAPKPAGK